MTADANTIPPQAAQDAALLCARSAAWSHIVVSLVLLLIFVLMCGVVDRCAHSRRVAAWLDDRDEASHRLHNRPSLHTRNFGDYFETLLFDEVPRSRFDSPGAYFFGSSNLVFSADFDALPPERFAIAHNYGFPGGNVTEIAQFIQYLRDHDAFLKSNRQHTLVAFCLTPNDLLEPPGNGGFFPPYLEDSGFWHYDAVRGISAVPMGDVERAIKTRRMRWSSFLHRCVHFVNPPTVRAAYDPKAFAADVRRTVRIAPAGSNERQFDQLDRLLQALEQDGVPTALVMLPTGSWYQGQPLAQAFADRIPAMCASRGAAMIDLRHLLKDDEFMDAHHPTYAGAVKVRDALAALAVERVARFTSAPSTSATTPTSKESRGR